MREDICIDNHHVHSTEVSIWDKSAKEKSVPSIERLFLNHADAGVLGLQRRRIQSGARDEAGSLRAFV